MFCQSVGGIVVLCLFLRSCCEGDCTIYNIYCVALYVSSLHSIAVAVFVACKLLVG